MWVVVVGVKTVVFRSSFFEIGNLMFIIKLVKLFVESSLQSISEFFSPILFPTSSPLFYSLSA